MTSVIPKMDLGVGEMTFIFCGKHPLIMTRIQVCDPEPKYPLVVTFHDDVPGQVRYLIVSIPGLYLLPYSF